MDLHPFQLQALQFMLDNERTPNGHQHHFWCTPLPLCCHWLFCPVCGFFVLSLDDMLAGPCIGCALQCAQLGLEWLHGPVIIALPNLDGASC